MALTPISAILDVQNDHNFATVLPIDLMFGSRVGFPATLRFIPRGLHTRIAVARNPGGSWTFFCVLRHMTQNVFCKQKILSSGKLVTCYKV